MVFSDLFFLFVFIPLFALCYLIGYWLDNRNVQGVAKQSNAYKNMMLVIFSLVFYAWGEPIYVFLMLICVYINYLSGLWIARSEGGKRRMSLVFGLIGNLLILGIFKYAGFFAQVLNDMGLPVGVPQISLPIGISFYTFQSISYLVDVYRRESPVQYKFKDLLLYISMFPQLVAGPIVRYGTVAEEIHNRSVCIKDFSDGAFRFLIGLGKKVILANQFSEIADQFLADGLGSLSMSGAWIGVLAFTFQIYFDFSGYSDMAIGMGRCLGFHFNENFNHPYCCNSITDFWRRWHMSLGSFFRDYVYIPLGGNRSHQSLNIMIVWFLTGMWHGASWNFIIWGLYFGLIVMIEKYTILRIKDRVPGVLMHIYSLLLVVVGWGIFYFDDFGNMTQFFSSFVGNTAYQSDVIEQGALLDNFWLWVAAIVFSLPIRSRIVGLADILLPGDNVLKGILFVSARVVVSVAILTLSVALLVGATNNAFIYTRF